ncbi:alpha-hydroxy acid oxidase [Magnetofaba australis]|uniref:Putative FMN-dependent alpha-hydroxy acid dehydrogenase n=1 Tax=Magnetofaba australis IT-1 TaxID=1434232 RepID=A0A1Y2JYZ2_9PROT|nr:alpha-hydroxy acid oxidase [Magnetofaba australis]OSM00115.1 putative FMN-dependent alpha-hydroxy acid dehydrogenase [Magnetofaba australis IT-1]
MTMDHFPKSLDFENDPPRSLREVAHWARKMAIPGAYEWLNSAAGEATTCEMNRRFFRETAIRPRVLRDVSHINTRRIVLGHDLRMPVVIAPLGHLTQFHEDGEAELAAGAEGEGTLLCISTQTRLTLEEIRARAPRAELIWQVYCYGDRAWIADQVAQAKAHGVVGIAVCVDAPIRPVRYLDQEIRYDGRKHGRRTQPPVMDTSYNARITWNDMDWLKSQCGDLPFLIKGVMTPEDAALSVAHGADVVWVSNHGGRQIDSGLATLEVLPEIRQAVGNDVTLFFDGGVRTAGDVYKALCLGADVVALGRLAAYGLITAGAPGVKHVLNLLHTELEANLAMSGIADINLLGPHMVKRRW